MRRLSTSFISIKDWYIDEEDKETDRQKDRGIYTVIYNITFCR